MGENGSQLLKLMRGAGVLSIILVTLLRRSGVMTEMHSKARR